MQKNKIDIRSLDIDSLKETLVSMNEKTFRAKQIYQWLWQKGVSSFNEMTNLSDTLRNKLKAQFKIYPLKVQYFLKSNDKTIKVVFNTWDKLLLEGVVIPSKSRSTACISSQTGCALGCTFCATSQLKKFRNLTADEIVDQVVILNKLAIENYKQKLTNIVMMGMGEPFMNYFEVKKALEILVSTEGLALSPTRITVSTVGIVEKIRDFAEDFPKINLAISLHSVNDDKRTKLMPINKKYPISALKEAIIYYHDKTRNRITFEYLMLNDFNDNIKDAEDLALFCKSFPVKINIIRYNKTEHADFKDTDEYRLKKFVSYLEEKNMLVNVRKSRGKDIFAACGQLANTKHNKE